MPKSADMNVDAAVECSRGPSTRQVEQLIARQNVARSFDESEQEIEFGGAQIDQGACRREELASSDIKTPARELEDAAGSRRRTRSGHGRPAQHRPNSSQTYLKFQRRLATAGSRLEAAYHRADTAIQRVVDLLGAA
jgi:hypothetical protein